MTQGGKAPACGLVSMPGQVACDCGGRNGSGTSVSRNIAVSLVSIFPHWSLFVTVDKTTNETGLGTVQKQRWGSFSNGKYQKFNFLSLFSSFLY